MISSLKMFNLNIKKKNYIFINLEKKKEMFWNLIPVFLKFKTSMVISIINLE